MPAARRRAGCSAQRRSGCLGHAALARDLERRASAARVLVAAAACAVVRGASTPRSRRARRSARACAAVVGVGVGEHDQPHVARARRPTCSSARSRWRQRARLVHPGVDEHDRRRRPQRPGVAVRHAGPGRAAAAGARRRAAPARRGRRRVPVGLRTRRDASVRGVPRRRDGTGRRPAAGRCVARAPRALPSGRWRRSGASARAPESEYRDEDGDAARAARLDDARPPGASTPRRWPATLLSQEDAWQRAVEFLFERLAVRWDDRGRRAAHAPEGAARALPLRLQRRAAAGSATCCASTWPSTSRSCRRRERPTSFARLLAGYCLEVQPGQQVLVRSTTLAAPLLLALQREMLERDAWPLLRVALPGQAEGFWAAARDAPPRRASPRSSSPRPSGTDASLRIQAPENTQRAGRRRPGAAGARRPRPRAAARGAAARGAGAITVWPTPAAAPSRPAWAPPTSRALVERALFLDRDDPVAAWGELRDRQARLIERLAPRARDPHRGRGHRPDAARRGPHVGQLRRQAQHAVAARSSPARTRTRPRAASASRSRRARAASTSRASTLRVPRRAASSTRAPSAATTTCRPTLDTDDGRPRAWASSGSARTSASTGRSATILFDEKIGGTVHLALGRSYPETGGTNESAVHWDLICDLRAGGRLTADGARSSRTARSLTIAVEERPGAAHAGVG